MEAFVQMTGNVGSDVELRTGNGSMATFRLACTPRVRKNGDWGDGPTTWISVSCFRALAEQAAASVHKGDPVIVTGKLRTNVWERDGQVFERLNLQATAIGHDLNFGTSSFRRTERQAPTEDRDDELGELLEVVESQGGAGADRDARVPQPA